MQYRKVGPNEYQHPNGRKKTRAQVNKARKQMGSRNPNSRRQRDRRSIGKNP